MVYVVSTKLDILQRNLAPVPLYLILFFCPLETLFTYDAGRLPYVQRPTVNMHHTSTNEIRPKLQIAMRTWHKNVDGTHIGTTTDNFTIKTANCW